VNDLEQSISAAHRKSGSGHDFSDDFSADFADDFADNFADNFADVCVEDFADEIERHRRLGACPIGDRGLLPTPKTGGWR